ncbi:MAG: hypothetical protein JWO95_19 [Verrucomicrobiales bacterium]|nr:hypothetical protein [Verrucomicrobiales bacterium]
MARWQSANVLQTTPGGRQLWRFNASGTGFAFAEEQRLSASEPIPSDIVGKDWRTLLRSKLNIAWLPADKIFLRAIQLPSSDLTEIRSMVELQIEKLSPLPVAQIVWSIQLLPNTATPPAPAAEGEVASVPLQTVIVIIAGRGYVEEFLGELENQGFLTDRLEVPGLEQLIATKATDNGVWIYPNAPGEPLLIAWWAGGTLHNLAMVSLPDTDERGDLLKNQIEQMAWAGELEGWMTEPPKLHLVATPEQAKIWEPVVRTTAESELANPQGVAGAPAAPVEVFPALKPADAAAKTAESAAQDGSTTNLLPDDYARRYRQQFVDGLWMRALFSALVLYGVAVVVYFAVVLVLNYRASAVTTRVASLGLSYTNALKDEEQLRILKDRQELKYAALDCWKAVAQSMPNDVTLDDMAFQRGKLDLRGTAPADSQIAITEFNDAVRAARTTNGPVFNEVGPPAITIRGDRAEWRFSCYTKGYEGR